MSSKRILIAVILILSVKVAAQQKLTHQQAVKIALEKNVMLNQQENNLYSSQVQRNQSIAAF